MIPALAPIRTWIFDLDNTLYPASVSLFPAIDARMTTYISDLLGLDPEAARRVQKQYFHAHGTTLAGLMADHGTDPHHFLDYVHDVEMDVLEDLGLAALIGALPGRKLVFTNGDANYAARVLDRIGLADTFEAVHDVHATQYRPKPDPVAYQGLCDAYAIDPRTALFVEDMARNLAPAKAIGMTTVWIDNGSEQGPGVDRSYIDYTVADLGDWLRTILETPA
jgi:putative hydrolase of the HAD superfamily